MRLKMRFYSAEKCRFFEKRKKQENYKFRWPQAPGSSAPSLHDSVLCYSSTVTTFSARVFSAIIRV